MIVCLYLVVRRRREGVTIAVPLVVTALGLVRIVLLCITVSMLVANFRQLRTVQREERPAVLSNGIREATVYVKWGMWLELPLLLGAWVVDRALRKRGPRFARAQTAPAGACCASHPEVAALLVCSRCGSFMCSTCGSGGRECSACRARIG